MNFFLKRKGFTVLEVLIAIAVFLIFAVGVYSSIIFIFKIVYQSRMAILETAILNEKMEVVRNMNYEDVGLISGIPVGLLPGTTTTIRNGSIFVVTTTVRNLDDPFDGTAAGPPTDSVPADYKLVEMSIKCLNCMQQKPVTLSTRVSPKQLEGASDNGNLFIYVFDSNGLAVPSSSIHITNTIVDPNIDMIDVTDSSGYLRILDAPTSTMGYNITVTKNGFSSDYTTAPSVAVPNPSKPPANVVTQMITDISFSIDQAGSMNITTVDGFCSVVSGADITIHGDKLIGTSPDIYKYDENFTTDSSGIKYISNAEWDNYTINATGSSYVLAGSTPVMPIDLTPGLAQDISLVLAPKTTNSLLVIVNDAGTGLPLSGADVRLYNVSYDSTLTTGLGYVRQTDWSGGSGQDEYIYENKYWVDNGAVAIDSPAGDLKLQKISNFYLTSGYLESSTIDLTQGVNFNNVIFSPLSQPPQTGNDPITFQLATTSTLPATWNFVGPDGTTSTYYTDINTNIWSGHNGDRYMRYKIYLNTDDNNYTPQLSEVAFTYTNSCAPPGQAFFTGLSAGTYNIDVTKIGYNLNTGSLDVSDNISTVVNLSVN